MNPGKAVGILSTAMVAALTWSGCAKTPTQPTSLVDRSMIIQTPSAVAPPRSIAEGKQRENEIAMPSLDNLAAMIEQVLARNPNPSEGDVLAAVWPPLTEVKQRAPFAGSYPFSTTKQEFWLIVAYPKYASATYSARNDAVAEALRQWPGDPTDTKTDAFRHCYWNILMAKRAAPWWAIAISDAHESDTSDALDRRMDLSNNAVGQSIFLNDPKRTDQEYVSLVKSWTYVFTTALRLDERRAQLVYIRQ